MNSECIRFIKHIIGNSAKHDKKAVINDVQDRFSLIKDRTVYHNNYFAVRFSYSK